MIKKRNNAVKPNHFQKSFVMMLWPLLMLWAYDAMGSPANLQQTRLSWCRMMRQLSVDVCVQHLPGNRYRKKYKRMQQLSSWNFFLSSNIHRDTKDFVLTDIHLKQKAEWHVANGSCMSTGCQLFRGTVAILQRSFFSVSHASSLAQSFWAFADIMASWLLVPACLPRFPPSSCSCGGVPIGSSRVASSNFNCSDLHKKIIRLNINHKQTCLWWSLDKSENNAQNDQDQFAY